MHLIRIHCRDSVLLYVCNIEGQCPVLAVLDDLKKIEEEVKVRAHELCEGCREYSSG